MWVNYNLLSGFESGSQLNFDQMMRLVHSPLAKDQFKPCLRLFFLGDKQVDISYLGNYTH